MLPLELIWPTFWLTGVFWICNIRPDFWIFLEALLLIYLSFSAFQGVGLAISASGMPMARAMTTSILLITYFFAWSGFFVSLERVPRWISWVADVNPFRFTVELMMQVIMQGDVEFDCGGGATTGDVSKVGAGCVQTADGTWVLSGAAALQRHGMTSSPGVCLAVIFGVLVGARLLAFGLLWRDLRTAINGAEQCHTPSVSEAKSSVVPSEAAETV